MSEFESVEEELKFMADLSDNMGDPENSLMFMRYLAAIRTAQSELAALREGPAECQKVLSYSGNESDAYSNSALHTELEDTQQRLTAAEQRNATLVELLREVQKAARKQARAHGYPTLFERVDAALKPTESGASE